VARAHPPGERLAGLGEEHAAIGLARRQPLALQPSDGLDRGRMRDPEPAGDVGRPRLTGGDEQIGDASTVMQVAAATGAQYVRSRSLESVVQEIGSTVVKRLEAEDYRAPTQLLVLFGLHRALSLAPPDPYGDDEGAPSLSKSLLAILADGPEVGVHVVIDANRGRSVEMRLGSDVLAELTLRVAGSEAEQRDLGLVVGSFGDVPPLRYGQLILGDQLKGTVKRVRGYRIVSERPSAQVEESSNV